MPDKVEEYAPARWNEMHRVISRALFRGGRRPELRLMADSLALKIVQAMLDAGLWVCRKRPRGVRSKAGSQQP